MKATLTTATTAIFFALTTAANAGCGKLCDEFGFWMNMGFESEAAQIDKVKAEIDAGADINGTTENGDTPIQLALIHVSSHEIIRLLLESGSDTSVLLGDQKQNLVHVASDSPSARLETIQMLEAAGVPLGEETADGNLATHLLAASTSDHGPDIIIYLAGKGVSVDATGPDGNTPLHFGAANAYSGGHVVATLLDAGADPCTANAAGELAADLIPAESDWSSDNPGREGFSRLVEATASCDRS